MDSIRIRGGTPLEGAIRISGAKNAALPLLCASLLSDKPLTLSNMPYLADIVTMVRLLMQHGVDIRMSDDHEKWHVGDMTLGRSFILDGSRITSREAPYEMVRKMRASVLVLGPLLARFGEARVSLPGGCAIGSRPVDLHLKALEQMGAEITLDQGYIVASAPDGLKGTDILFDHVSVGATENIMMAATLAEGTTILNNAAREPEVQDLAHCLVKMGASIEGIGTATLTIHGRTTLRAAHHRVIADRIEAGTYVACTAMASGDMLLKSAPVEAMRPLLEKCRETGVMIDEIDHETLHITSEGALEPVDIITQPHPGFPTDMQAQFMAMMLRVNGTSTITETIFENRFMHVPELMRMGADIHINGRSAVVKGVDTLVGAQVMATDLRASVSLVIAALATRDETMIHRIYHLDRGYEHLEMKLAGCGADIVRMRE
ncbi:MAG: UDP-N-acetylglucosamine 1-carboxyvinyltransferase [Sphaerospermopsis sp. SIO1G2]|nr:UDP-N-acetylglucosamine 1-carboxyvinyltransferase [Sphaerospermopsis sp. SIO1G2]